MKKMDMHTNKKIRGLCRDINNRAGDRARLEQLVGRLQQALREEQHGAQPMRSAQSDNPFDKILVS